MAGVETFDAGDWDHEKYLLEEVKLKPDQRYTFWFEDGSGFHGTPREFGPYAKRRFKVFPKDTYEIDDEDRPITRNGCYEIPPPEYVGQVLKRGLKDPRF